MMITERSKQVISFRPNDAKRVGDGCWIGMGVCILPGARLGDGCVVGAGSVVAGELGPNCVAVGNPARAIKSR